MTDYPDWIINAMREIIQVECAGAFPCMPAGTRISAVIAKHAPPGQQGANWQPITEVPREIIENRTPIVVATSHGLRLVRATVSGYGFRRYETVPGNWAVTPTHWLADMPEPPVNTLLLKETK